MQGIWKLLLWESLFWKQISQLLIVMQTVHCLLKRKKTILQMRRFRKLRNRLLKKRIRKQNSDLDGFISGDASAEDEKKTIHVIIENGNTDTDNGTQITDPVIDSGDYSAGEYSGGGSSASSSGEKILHKPQVLLEDNNLSGQNLKAGSVTEMSLTFRNKSRSQNVFGLKISISADTKGIEFERNSFYVQRLTPGEAITLKQKVTIAEDCTPRSGNSFFFSGLRRFKS